MTEMKLVVTIAEDGKSSEKYIPLSEAEIDQRAIDVIAAEEAAVARQAELDAIEALKVSARAKLEAGEPLTAEESALMIP
jgi:hypothetical protein